MSDVPRPPARTRAAGRRLWQSIVRDYDLDEHELALLREAVRTVDQLDTLAKVAHDDGPMVDTPSGPKVHPALVESRQLKIALARLLAALRLPSGEEESRPQRRGGARGVYSLPRTRERLRGVS